MWGADRVGIKISPFTAYGDNVDSNPLELFAYFLGELSKKNILFVEGSGWGEDGYKHPEDCKVEFKNGSCSYSLRKYFNGMWVANGGFTQESGQKAIDDDAADMISYGSLAVANPDLPEKFEKGLPLYSMANMDPKDASRLLYGPGETASDGYTELKFYAPKE